VYKLAHLSLSAESISTLNSEEDDYLDMAQNVNRSATDSFVSVGSQDSYASQHAANFDHDASASIYDSLEKGHESANIQLELTALRMATNASDHQVRRSLVLSFVKRIVQLIKSGTSVKSAVEQVFGQHKELLERSIFDKNQSKKVDQVDFMMLLQAELSHRENGNMILLNSAMKLVELDVIEDDGVMQWWDDPKSSDGKEMQAVREKTQQLIDFLNQSSESEEDDDEEEDEDDEEEDEDDEEEEDSD
jgi:translation initiation factor eIF-2B subunit epsilon